MISVKASKGSDDVDCSPDALRFFKVLAILSLIAAAESDSQTKITSLDRLAMASCKAANRAHKIFHLSSFASAKNAFNALNAGSPEKAYSILARRLMLRLAVCMA